MVVIWAMHCWTSTLRWWRDVLDIGYIFLFVCMNVQTKAVSHRQHVHFSDNWQTRIEWWQRGVNGGKQGVD